MPATATKTKTRVQPQAEVETAEETEVVVDTGLVNLIEKWEKSKEQANKTQEQADKSWINIARYVRDHEISKAQLHYALVELRGMKESSAKVEISRLMRFQNSQAASDMLDRKIEGDDDITLKDLKSASVKRGEKHEVNPAEATEKRLVMVAKYAISEAGIEDISEFGTLARKAHKIAMSKLEEAAKRNGEQGDSGETEAEEPDEEADEEGTL
jgi:hypothetical protein